MVVLFGLEFRTLEMRSPLDRVGRVYESMTREELLAGGRGLGEKRSGL